MMKYLRFLVCLLFPIAAFAQGVFTNPKQVLGTVNGITRPVANATVTVCAASAAGIPCSPALVGVLFKDAALTQPLSNPFTTDASGNYQFAIAAGNYTVTETGAGFSGYSYQVSATCSPVGGCSFVGPVAATTLSASGSVSLNAGGTFNGAFAHSGTEAFTGPWTRFGNGLMAHGNFATTPTGSTIDSLVTAFGSNQGKVTVLPDYAGANETVFANNVFIEDLRRSTVLIGASAGYAAQQLVDGFNGAGTTNRVFTLAGQCHATAGGTGLVGQGECIGLFGAAERTGGTRPIWGVNTQAQATVAGNSIISNEADVNNNTGTDALITTNPTDQQIAYKAVSGGSNSPLAAFQSAATTPGIDGFKMGADLNGWRTIGLRLTAPAVQGLAHIYLIPTANDTNLEIVGRNALDNANLWSIQNAGNANFPLVNTPIIQNAGGAQLAVPTVGTAIISDTAIQTLPNKTLTAATLNGITNGTGLQLFNTATTCTTGASIGAICTTGAITLPVAYADTNYRLSCTGQGSTNVPIVQTYAKSNTTFTITIAALTAAAATFTSYDCSATHN